ncbi:hypothetical protein BC834DRAFT_130239 [Gloeopeniophorella convolvens]|nr:hypothetical protein BC834DRAFT_130239 [Gloeopeniophorella convolvens]
MTATNSLPILPPTGQLPPIKKLGKLPTELLLEAIQYLQAVYNPVVCSSRRTTRQEHHARKDSDVVGSKALDSIRADAFEHAHAMRWLIALIAQATLRADADAIEPLVHAAAALLALCAGAASAGTRTRTYALGGVRVQLTDVPLQNDDFGSVGAQTWGSACLLAEMVTEAPARFGLGGGGGGSGGGGEDGIRVLELGAGTGLVSLAVGKVLELEGRRAEVVASDYYPTVLENLRMNIKNNFPSGAGAAVSAHFLDWAKAADPADALEAPFDAPFDEVFGADIVYELEHAAWIRACLLRLLRLTGRFHLAIPLRTGFSRESETVERVFPHVDDTRQITGRGPLLCITQKESITCDAGSDMMPGGKGEVEYAHYTIEWAAGVELEA